MTIQKIRKYEIESIIQINRLKSYQKNVLMTIC